MVMNEATKENPNEETIPEPNNSAHKADVQPKTATPSGGANPDKLSYMSSSAPKADNNLQEENNQLDLQGESEDSALVNKQYSESSHSNDNRNFSS